MRCIICNKKIDESKYLDVALCSSPCFNTYFWNGKASMKNDKRVAIINGEYYLIGNENGASGLRGHGGRKFKIKFFDDRELTTTNLWHIGKIPGDFKSKLPNNAVFVE